MVKRIQSEPELENVYLSYLKKKLFESYPLNANPEAKTINDSDLESLKEVGHVLSVFSPSLKSEADIADLKNKLTSSLELGPPL